MKAPDSTPCAPFLHVLLVIAAACTAFAAPAPSTPSAPGSFLQPGRFDYSGFLDERKSFWQALESGSVPSASQVIEHHVAPAPSSGAAGVLPLSVESASDLATQAALDLTMYHNIGDGGKPIDQPLVQRTFAQLPELAATPKAVLIQGFANAIIHTMSNQGSAGSMAGDLTAPLLALAQAAGLSDAFSAAFSQAKSSGTTAGGIAIELDNAASAVTSHELYAADGFLAAVRSAAIGVYGITPANLQQAQGNTTAIGTLLLGSAILGVEGSGPPAAAAHNTSDAVSASSLSPQARTEAFAQAILQALQQQGSTGFASFTPNATAVLVDAAVSVGSADAVTQGFAQARSAPLQFFCQVQAAAATFSQAASQATNLAIPAAFGPKPCGGATGNYLTSSSLTGAQTTCSSPATGHPATSGCVNAAADVRAKGSMPCVVPNATASGPLFQYQTTDAVSLAAAGTCQIILGGGAGNSLPCSQVADMATTLSAVCSDSQSTTGALFYPDGFHFSNSTYIALTSR